MTDHRGRAVRFYNVRLSDRDAWFGATAAGLLNALGMLLELAIVRKTPGVSAQPAALSALVGFLLLLVLFVRRNRPSVKWAAVIYLLNTGAVIAALVATNLQFAMFSRHWEPFQASKLGCLIAAMIAPGFWVGLISILAHARALPHGSACRTPSRMRRQESRPCWERVGQPARVSRQPLSSSRNARSYGSPVCVVSPGYSGR